MRAFVVLCFALTASIGFAADVILLDSQPGDIGGGVVQHITSADGAFAASASAEHVGVTFFGAPGHFVLLDFATAPGLPLAPGYYDDATRWPFQTVGPGLDVALDGRGCNELTGRFIVFELVADGAGGVARFAADFEQHCEDRAPALFGAVRFHSDVPITRPCSDADGDGEPDATDACPDTPLGEQVDAAGCSVAQFCARIDVDDGAGRRSCRAADWLNDGAGRRRPSRDCQLLRTPGAIACGARDPASRPDSVVELDSEPGDFIGGGQTRTLTRADGDFLARANFDNGVDLFFDNFSAGPPYVSWNFSFAAPGKAPLVPGVYDGATRYPFQASTVPGLAVYGDGRACNTSTGRFEVLSLVLGPEDRIDRFEATFEQHCEGATAALRGRIRYVRPKPFGLTCLDTDGDGEDDATDRCAATPAGVPVDQAGCSLAQFCGGVVLSSGAACGAADWQNDSPRRSPRDCSVVGTACVPR